VQELGQKLAIALDECSKLKSDLANVKNDKAQLEKKMQKAQQIIRKLQSDLEEEKQMSKLISADKETLTAKNVELEKLREVVRLKLRRRKTTTPFQEIKNLQDQVNDLMMHFEAQTKLAQQVSDAKITTEELESCDVGVEETNLQKIKKNRKRNK
jgi:chromosome segregation ATPase